MASEGLSAALLQAMAMSREAKTASEHAILRYSC